jgi:hypothetical protein
MGWNPGSKDKKKCRIANPDPQYCLLVLGFLAGFRIRIHLIRIRIQHFRLNTYPDPDPGRIQGFMAKN